MDIYQGMRTCARTGRPVALTGKRIPIAVNGIVGFWWRCPACWGWHVEIVERGHAAASGDGQTGQMRPAAEAKRDGRPAARQAMT